MGLANPYLQYQHNAVQSANPGDLVIMLFDGLIKYLKIAINAIEENDISNSNNALVRSQDIIDYLNNTLDMQFELSRNLSSLYDFMKGQLISANIKKETELVEEVLGLAAEMRDTWRQALQLAKTQE
ncbi:MAG: flagellar biosynthesis protein FliS [Peptococcaceae bacterium BICA1-7]|nr:MAG: flagellar biosynthesis protein FliS [Peptococcaceae bacterium BICA1-7]HBV96595.1 flagellar export chaperone FliS [Desulfotomaculum sp.]